MTGTGTGRRHLLWLAAVFCLVVVGLLVGIPRATVATEIQAVGKESAGYPVGPGAHTGDSCAGCHASAGASALALSGPASVVPGSTNSYSLAITGPQDPARDLAVSISGGVVTPGAGVLLVLNGEAVHLPTTAAGRAGTVILSFDWTAPSSPGVVTMYGSGRALGRDGTLSMEKASVVSLPITVEES